MKGIIVLIFSVGITINLSSQTTINFNEASDDKLYIKLYGHIDYNQKIESGKRNSGKMDVHRLVTLFGYQFNRKTQFVSEIEVEHVKEIFIEQAFVKHRLNKGISLKAGLILIPMGFINEYHEPTFFYSVERPLLDKNIIPTTWREIGFGITGLLSNASLKYQLYLVNNPISYDDGAKINGEKGIRSGRQKGAESIVSSFPAISGQLEYFGWDNTKLGLSIFHGKTNTSLYDDFQEITDATDAIIDSSTLRVSMATIHSSYNFSNWTFRAQYTISSFSNTEDYNQFTNSDVPNLMHGMYALLAYDFIKDDQITLSPFFRYAHLNNHLKVDSNLEKNLGLKKDIITFGLNYKPNPGVVFKLDYQFYTNGNGANYQQFNSGVGVWF